MELLCDLAKRKLRKERKVGIGFSATFPSLKKLGTDSG